MNKMAFVSTRDDGRCNKTCLSTTFCYKFIFVLIHRHLCMNKMAFVSTQDDGRCNKTCLSTTFCYKFIFVLIHLVIVKILLKLMLKKHNATT